MPCLGHIINLAVQAILGPGGLNDQPPENENLYPSEDDDDKEEEVIEPEVASLTKLKRLRKGIVKIRYNIMNVVLFGYLFCIKMSGLY